MLVNRYYRTCEIIINSHVIVMLNLPSMCSLWVSEASIPVFQYSSIGYGVNTLTNGSMM